jgi:hypothetical protein
MKFDEVLGLDDGHLIPDMQLFCMNKMLLYIVKHDHVKNRLTQSVHLWTSISVRLGKKGKKTKLWMRIFGCADVIVFKQVNV